MRRSASCPGLVHGLLLLERIHQINGREEPHLLAVMLDSLDAERGGKVGLAGSWAADQDDVVGAIDEGAGMQLMERPVSSQRQQKQAVRSRPPSWQLCAPNADILRQGPCRQSAPDATPLVDRGLPRPLG